MALATIAGAVLLVTACGALPQRAAALTPLPAQATAARLSVVGTQGVVGEAAEARELARVKAEGSGALLQRQLGALAAQGEQNLYRGNSARLLVDGPQTFAAMKAAIAAARERVLVEFYIVEDAGVAAEVGELLKRKAAEGVHVSLLYDSVGSIGTAKAFFDSLQAGGVAVCAFNPVNPLERPGSWGLLQRNHRKMLAVDSEVAFTGGINLSNVYAQGSLSKLRGSSGAARLDSGTQATQQTDPQADPTADATADAQGWRDTQIELRGPVVTAMAVLFRQTWQSQRCPGVLPAGPTASLPAPGQRIVKLVAGDPQQGINPTYSTLIAGIESAQRSVHLTMAYFAPGPDLVQALCDAARRGVDVSLVLPGRSDVTMVLNAARSYYAELLQAGVQIHEMQHAVMHAKTAVIDGVLSSVGSSNLDWRSIVANSEIDVIVLGDDFGQQLEQQFQRDIAVARRIDPGTWQQRGLARRALERLARLLEPLL